MQNHERLLEHYKAISLCFSLGEKQITIYDAQGDFVVDNEDSDSCDECLFALHCMRKSNILKNPDFPDAIIEEARQNGKAMSHFISSIKGEDGKVISQRVDYTFIALKSYDNEIIGFCVLSRKESCELAEVQMLEELQRNSRAALSENRILPFRYNLKTKKVMIYLDGVASEHSWSDAVSLIHPDDVALVEKNIDDLISGRKFSVSVYERVKFHEFGEYRYCQNNMHSVLDKDGKCESILGTQCDCSENLKNEIEAKNARELLERVRRDKKKKEDERNYIIKQTLEAYGINIWRFSFEERIFRPILCRPNFIILNKTYEEVYDMLLSESKEVYKSLGNDLMQEGIDRMVRVLVIKHPETGELSYHRNAYALQRNNEGVPIAIIGAEKNITSEVEQEAMLVEYKEKIDMANNRLNQVMIMGKIMPFIWHSVSNTYIITSPENKSAFGNLFRENTSLCKGEELINYIHPNDRDMVLGFYERLKKGEISEANFTCRYDPSMKFERTYTVTIVPYPFEKTEPSFIGYMQDITERQALIDRLIEEKMKAEESERLKASFLANMSHEIRTPLNSIIGFSDLMGETDDIDERREYSKIINKNNDLLLKIIEDIIELSCIEAGRKERRLEHVILNNLFSEIYTQFKQQYVKPGVELLLSVPKNNVEVIIDNRRTHEVLSNLVNNAMKFTDKGHIKIGFVEYDAKNIKLFVEDTGRGIKQEDQSCIFNTFEKVDSFVQGVGLGLSICKAYVENAGGRIGVDSELDKGSTFWAILPKGL